MLHPPYSHIRNATTAAIMLFINVRKYNAALLDACSTSPLGLKVVVWQFLSPLASALYCFAVQLLKS
jgi:hypothetical protein